MSHERKTGQQKDAVLGTNDAAKPHGGAEMLDQSRHAHKHDKVQPACGPTPNTSKGVYDKAHGRGGPANASSGFNRQTQKANGKNRHEVLADPQGA